ncbi:hypothetical protein MKW94_020863 [Papaver nudicaule]|uniref:PPM-type phosphatase domain-containing protein n=1 Tax=Papaver nudicaule TaxID=74823 RepID=A0AA41VLG9_PAPNU|nr:hypothetical protein [Papaver nudicaule]
MGNCMILNWFRGRRRSLISSSGLSQNQRRRYASLSPKRDEQGTTSKLEDDFRKSPGRRIVNGITGLASLWTKRGKGKKGTNQDAMIVWENFASRPGTTFCGVFDGHGLYGHKVAERVRDCLPLSIFSHCQHWDTLEEDNQISAKLEEAVDEAFKVMDKEPRNMHPKVIDCLNSGTTAVAMVRQGKHLVTGNVGDSRAVLGTRDRKGSLIAVRLTKDLTPNLKTEAERIRNRNGRVFALKGDVARVWLPDKDSPGLAMSRAFGDFCFSKYGVTSEPEVSYRRLTDKDEFVVLATDGIWDVLSNKEVVNIVRSAPAKTSAARALVDAAVSAWNEYSTSKVDDCTAVVFHLCDSSTSRASSSTRQTTNASISNIHDTTGTTRPGKDEEEKEQN